MRYVILLVCAAALATALAGCGDNLQPVIPAACGDHKLDPGEGCDDGNTAAGDGCSATCIVEHGYQCAGSPSVCMTRCGDGLQAGDEKCDDGNTTNDDGCSSSCTVEHGYGCTGEPSTCTATCGDGVLGGGEECDDGNKASNDGCSATCKKEPGWVCTGEPSTCAATCGDGIISGAEQCDDHGTVNGDGCDDNCVIEHGYGCTGAPSVCTSTCGDGILASNEGCDDHGKIDGDGCSATCTVEHGYQCAGDPSVCASTCGDGVLASDEQCDDHGTANGDGCSGTCQVEHGYQCSGDPSVCASTCGDGVLASDEQCDDHGTAPGDGCDDKCKLEAGWSCTGEPTACTSVCGDGLTVGNEQCDDGNNVNLDGCNSACRIDLFAETEPNDTPATANGPFTPDVRITGRVAAPSDVDVFAITVAATADLSLETFDADGLGVCNNADTTLTLLAADGTTVLAADDDSGLGRCSLIDPGTSAAAAHVAAGTYYVVVRSFGGDQLIPGYNLVIRELARCGNGVLEGSEECDGGPGCTATCDRVPTCGDGHLDGSEQCDDGNTAAGDGCSPGCAWEILGETEPNDSTATAGGPYTLPKLLGGAINPIGDVDYVAITLPATADLDAQTFDGAGIGTCAGIDTVLTLYDGAGVPVIERDNGGIGGCSHIDPTRASDRAARHLPAGTYYLAVRDFKNDGLIGGYTIHASLTAICGDGVVQGGEQCDGGAACTATCDRVPTCGDGFIDGSEQCDDGNVTPGDGCSATCQAELVTEVEPNNAPATATPITPTALVGGAIGVIGDNDYYAITLTTVTDLSIVTSTPSGACNIDTEIFLYASDGTTVLATNNDRDGSTCAALSAARDPGARHLAAGTYYLRVHEFGDDVALPAYRALVSATATCGNGKVEGGEECDGGAGCAASCDRVPVCGDGYVDAPETCDDGGIVPGDGCDAACALETVAEIEPNDTTGTADAAGLLLGSATVTGAINPVGDHDVYKLVVAAGGVYRLETFSSAGACTIATSLTVQDAGGAPLYTDNASGVATCSSLRLFLAAGTYYVQVNQRGDTATIPAYLLQVSPVTNGGSEAEPDDARGQATALPAADAYIFGFHQTVIDLDYYAVTVAPGKGVRAEVIEGSAAETCESGGIDSLVTLFDATGVVLGSDDDSGRGLCSMIDGTGASPANGFASGLAGGTYYLAVDASPYAQNQGSNAAKFDYRLVVEVR